MQRLEPGAHVKASRVEGVQVEAALRAVRLLAASQGRGSWVGVGDAYRCYLKASLPEPFQHVSSRHFLSAVQVSVVGGVLEARVVSRGRYGRVTRVRELKLKEEVRA